MFVNGISVFVANSISSMGCGVLHEDSAIAMMLHVTRGRAIDFMFFWLMMVFGAKIVLFGFRLRSLRLRSVAAVAAVTVRSLFGHFPFPFLDPSNDGSACSVAAVEAVVAEVEARDCTKYKH
jgi:hypothetical protein